MRLSPNDKIGRNDLCQCGSGKKYKKCCIDKAVAANIMDFAWTRLRKTEGEVIMDHLLPYVKNVLPKEVKEEAWEDFWPHDEAPPEEMAELFEEQMLIPWFLFNWRPEDLLNPTPIALHYQEKNGSKLSDYQNRFIEAACNTHYSFYVVLEVVKNQSLKLRDILLQREYVVKEKLATQFLHRGAIIFSRVLTIDDQSVLFGNAPYLVPSHLHAYFLELREKIEKENVSLTPELLREDYDIVLRGVYIDIILKAYQNPFPKLQNTDGEEIQLCKVFFSLNLTPEEAFEKILPLSLRQDPEDFLEEAKRDKQGHITRIEIPWLEAGNRIHQKWNNTVMGHITICKNKLTVEVNSIERAHKIQALLQDYLQDKIVYQKTLIESPEQKITSQSSASKTRQQKESKDITHLPEVQDYIKRLHEDHWKAWFDEPIPLLQNQTPRQAAESRKGRTLLDALLLDYENHNHMTPDNPLNPDINSLRKELGLD